MTIPTNQYEADEKFDSEQDKLEERIQRKENIIYGDSKLLVEAIHDYLKNYEAIYSMYEPVRRQAEQDIKNNED